MSPRLQEWCSALSTIIEPARAGFLGPGRITLGAHFGGVNEDRRSARCSLLKTKLESTLDSGPIGSRVTGLKRAGRRRTNEINTTHSIFHSIPLHWTAYWNNLLSC